MQLVHFLLGSLDIDSLILPFLHSLAYWGDELAGIVASPDDAIFDGVNFFTELCLQVGIGLFQLERPMELELRCFGGWATVAI